MADRSGNAGLAAQALHRRAFVHLQPDATGGEEGALADLAAAAEHAQEINDPIERNRLRSAILVDVARVHLEHGRLDEATRASTAAIAADRASSEAYELRAGAQWEQGQLQAAAAAAWAYYTRGNVRLQAGDAVGALSDFVASTVHDDPPLPARLASQASELRASLAPETRA